MDSFFFLARWKYPDRRTQESKRSDILVNSILPSWHSTSLRGSWTRPLLLLTVAFRKLSSLGRIIVPKQLAQKISCRAWIARQVVLFYRRMGASQAPVAAGQQSTVVNQTRQKPQRPQDGVRECGRGNSSCSWKERHLACASLCLTSDTRSHPKNHAEKKQKFWSHRSVSLPGPPKSFPSPVLESLSLPHR